MRLNKFLGRCGVASRRAADELVKAGKVSINGEINTELGKQVDPENDKVSVDGKPVNLPQDWIYLLLNKPVGVISSCNDPRDRKTVLHLLDDTITQRVFPVGRLDISTSGVLLLTNDGDLTQRLLHPSYQIEKVYQALISGVPRDQALDQISKGILLTDGHLARAKVSKIIPKDRNTELHLILTEGHKHEVRQILSGIGHPALALRRLSFAGLSISGLSSGQWRHLTPEEIKYLKKLTGLIS